MAANLIPDPATLKNEILASHRRCRKYGVNPHQDRNPRQERLSEDALKERLERNREFLDIAVAQIEELYQFVAGAGFAVNIADRDGYILHIIGDSSILKKLSAGNCWPGYRWTERDVGTSVISLSLERQIAVQINDEEHFCRRGHGHTCSAAPVFDPDNRLIGVIAMSGDAGQVHPHTLGMVITAARSIESQLSIRRTSKELAVRSKYMETILDSIDSGVMAVDHRGRITQVNNQGGRILRWDDPLEGKPLSVVFGDQIDIHQAMRSGFELVDREIFVRPPGRVVHLICTVKPIFSSSRKFRGIIVVFNEIHRIRKLVNEMAGTQARFTFEDIIGVSPAIQETKKLAMVSALGTSTVLLLGETGTGKELFAQAIHNHSERRGHPFLAINCGAIPRELLESELFGYSGGAFTGAHRRGRPGKFELASGGSVLLDEIGDMPPDMQVKLLRVLQTGEVCRIGEHKPIAVNVRIIAATNADLQKKVESGNFREDLFYRLNVLPISIPPLRERSDDILPLARHFLNRCIHSLNKPALNLSGESERALLAQRWPGNIRELENAVERAANLVAGDQIQPSDLGIAFEGRLRPQKPTTGVLSLAELEKQAIEANLEAARYNLSQASRTLGISRATLYNKIKKYEICMGA
jgi:transcriptional regulator of acetoin/glycerol metabolism